MKGLAKLSTKQAKIMRMKLTHPKELGSCNVKSYTHTL